MEITLGSIVTEYVLKAQTRELDVHTVRIPRQLYRALIQKVTGSARGNTILEWVTHMGPVQLLPQEETE